MSTEVAPATNTAPVTTLPVDETPLSVDAAATNAVIEGPGPVKTENVPPPTTEETTPEEPKTTTTFKETEVKPKEHRSPLGNLVNIFGRKQDKTSSEPKKEEKKVDAVPAEKVKAEEPVPTTAAAETTPAGEPVVAPEANKENEPVTPAAESGSPKRGGIFDKLKQMLDSKPKKEKETKKSSKEPSAEESKAEEVAKAEEAPATEATPIVATNEPEAAKPVEATPATEEVTPAVAESAPVTETPVATEEPAKEAVVAPAESSPAPKDEAAEKAKKDKKLGRRLSAKLFGFASPKKEKTNPLASPSEEKETPAATEAVSDAKKEDSMPEPVTAPEASSSTAVPLIAEEEVKPLAPVADEPAVIAAISEEPVVSATPVTIAEAPAVTKSDEPTTSSTEGVKA